MGHFVRELRVRGRRLSGKVAAVGALIVLAAAGSAVAFQALPPGAQVNNDPSAGIDGALSVSGEGPANADVVGGALTAGKVAVPWAVFRQATAAGVTTRRSCARSRKARGARAAAARLAGARAPVRYSAAR